VSELKTQPEDRRRRSASNHSQASGERHQEGGMDGKGSKIDTSGNLLIELQLFDSQQENLSTDRFLYIPLVKYKGGEK